MRVGSILPVRRMGSQARQNLQLELFGDPDPVALPGGDHGGEAGRQPGAPTHLRHAPQEPAHLPATAHAGHDPWPTLRHRWNAVLLWAASEPETQIGTLRAASASRLGPSVSYPCPRPSGQARRCLSFRSVGRRSSYTDASGTDTAAGRPILPSPARSSGRTSVLRSGSSEGWRTFVA